MELLSDRLRRHSPRRICIIKPSSLGDIAHSLPILPALRRLFPDAQVSWVVNGPFRSLLEGHRDLDHVLAYQRGSGISKQSVLASARLCGELREQRYDLTIDLQGLLRSGLMTASTRAPVRVGLADAREGAGWFYTDHVEAPRFQLHAVDRVLRVAQALGLADPRPEFHLPIRAVDRRWAREALAPLPRPRLILNLGARWLTKRWPPEHFAEIARRAAREFGAGLVSVGASEDRPLTAILRQRAGIGPLARPERPDLAAGTLRTGARSGPVRLERHRSPPPGRGGRGVCGWHLHMHESPT